MKCKLRMRAVWMVIAIGSAAAFATERVHAAAPGSLAKPVNGKGDGTGIEWAVGPAHVAVFLDGKKLGEAGALKFTTTSPGKHTVKLTNGKDETEMEVNVKKGQKVKFEFTFDAG